jgi:hypothetical protein
MLPRPRPARKPGVLRRRLRQRLPEPGDALAGALGGHVHPARGALEEGVVRGQRLAEAGVGLVRGAQEEVGLGPVRLLL